MRLGMAILSGVMLTVPTFGQRGETMRASISGGTGDNGKCTVEVEVDGSADVQLFGDTGRIRTVTGTPATWRRFQCNAPLPRNPVDFRFSGIDGRGRQTLIADPRNNRGVTVVRIDDPKGGREGYTFDVEWNNSASNSSFGSDRYRRNYPDNEGGRYAASGDVGACEDAVREQASRQYGFGDIRFYNTGSANNERGRDFVSGTFDGQRGSRLEQYTYTCTLNNNGRVRSVNIRPQGSARGGFGDLNASGDAIEQCRYAAMDRLRREGYDNVTVRWVDNNSNNRRVEGTVAARRNGSDYNLDFSCSVASDGRRISAVDVRPH